MQAKDYTKKRAGGSTSLHTISNKIVVASNKLYNKERWRQLSEEERRRKFRWARGSPEAKQVKKMEEEFRKRVDAVSELALEAKKIDKEKKTCEDAEKPC